MVFFKESDGWSIKNENLGRVIQEYKDIRTRSYQYIRGEIETLSYLDLIKIIFGPAPERKEIPDFLITLDNQSNKVSIEEYEELDERLNKLEHSKYLLDYLKEMENNRK